MKIATFLTTQLQTNTYLVLEGASAFVVDPGGRAKEIAEYAKKEGAKIEAVLLTHAHFDHTGGVAELQELGAEVLLHRDDAALLTSGGNLAAELGGTLRGFVPDVTLCGGETLTVAGLGVRVVHTPGHTAGSVCYIVEDCIFSGDTLFELSYGRTDFPTGSFSSLRNSIVNKLFALSGDYRVYPGHGAPTTLGFERKHNPISFD